MKPWHAGVMAWAYVMVAYVGSHVLNHRFFIAMMVAGSFGALAAFVFSVNRDFKR